MIDEKKLKEWEEYKNFADKGQLTMAMKMEAVYDAIPALIAEVWRLGEQIHEMRHCDNCRNAEYSNTYEEYLCSLDYGQLVECKEGSYLKHWEVFDYDTG